MNEKETREFLLWNHLRWQLALKLHILRTTRGWSIDDLAGKSGVAPPTIKAIENGNCKRITGMHLAKLAAAFDVAVDVHIVPWSAFTVPAYEEEALKRRGCGPRVTPTTGTSSGGLRIEL